MSKSQKMSCFLPLFVVLMSPLTITFAQKLPKVQTASVLAPASIKIDGKTIEWNDKFQAYNWGNHVYYTVSNDGNNLYLILSTDDKLGTAKIFRGGITFSIVPASNKAKLSVTYPAIKSRMESPNILEVNVLKTDKLLYGDTTNKAKMDSALAVSNNMLRTTYKQIHVTGIPELTDPFTPVYNAQNIVVAANFNKKLKYTYELAIPLKYVEAVVGKVKSFNYNIKLNSEPLAVPKSNTNPGRTVVLLSAAVAPPNSGGPNIDQEFLFNTTNFGGEYTLAK